MTKINDAIRAPEVRVIHDELGSLGVMKIKDAIAKAMELGADAVLVNTAIAVAGNPVLMAQAFKEAVIAGRHAFEAQLAQPMKFAVASSPLTAFLNDL